MVIFLSIARRVGLRAPTYLEQDLGEGDPMFEEVAVPGTHREVTLVEIYDPSQREWKRLTRGWG